MASRCLWCLYTSTTTAAASLHQTPGNAPVGNGLNYIESAAPEEAIYAESYCMAQMGDWETISSLAASTRSSRLNCCGRFRCACARCQPQLSLYRVRQAVACLVRAFVHRLSFIKIDQVVFSASFLSMSRALPS